jgi:hypothetical protein
MPKKRLKRSILSAWFFKPKGSLDFEPALKHPFEIILRSLLVALALK